MMKRVMCLYFLTCLILTLNAYALPSDTVKQIDGLMTTLHKRGQFNGSILVSINGKVIYRNAFGKSNFESKQNFTPTTISCLASVTKPFTAMAIMILAEKNKINYDDPVSKYILEIKQYSKGATIRNLLTHTSGIPDVGDLGIDHPGLTNDEVLKTLSKQDSLSFIPGQKYRYSNTGYMLLSIIIARVSGQTYNDFLAENIFKPLNMTSTFLSDGSKMNKSVAIGYNQFGKIDDDFIGTASAGLTTGDGGMYSNVDDLLKWNDALYTQQLVKQSTLAAAFTPFAVKEGTSNYGFGWNILEKDGDKFIWHTGSTAGFRAFIGTTLKERICIIMLTNKGNSKRMDINNAILNLLHAKPYSLPKISIAEQMYVKIKEKGIQFAIQWYNSLRTNNDTTFDFSESELNTLGYQLLYGDNKVDNAVQIFELNTRIYPTSSNAFDSLGEAYQKDGNKSLAVQSYQKAIDIDPTNLHAINMLKKLK